ncbi:hypothetical protein GCM10009838_53550 [Catenulispora subtropica]|uniref:Secreted protein n=1 Tax=Catenulispora subtropica TaxID=450798 RepID=A0ABN2SDB4_9ACTN
MFNPPGLLPKFDTCVSVGAATAGSALTAIPTEASSRVLPATAASRLRHPRAPVNLLVRTTVTSLYQESAGPLCRRSRVVVTV